MLTRLRVSGFKNLVDVDVRFGPFTCIAGANGVGKSNLFDAIGFLSALAELPLMEAARSIRDGRTADVGNLFHRVGGRHDETMSFAVEMIIPRLGEDDLGQEAEATITFLRYSVELALRKSEGSISSGGLILCKEELKHINITDSSQHLLFPHTKEWRQSALRGRRTVPFISTDDHAIIQLHQDRGGSGGGRPAPIRASSLPRTVLSSVNAAENRTAVLARREMQSWRRLQVEPAALREPDTFATAPRLGSDGSHLAATLFHLANGGAPPLVQFTKHTDASEPSTTYAQVANRLTDLAAQLQDRPPESFRRLRLSCRRDPARTGRPAAVAFVPSFRIMTGAADEECTRVAKNAHAGSVQSSLRSCILRRGTFATTLACCPKSAGLRINPRAE
jgi:hypothetical protein